MDSKQVTLYLLVMLSTVAGEFVGWGTSKNLAGRITGELQALKTASTSMLSTCLRMCQDKNECRAVQYNVSVFIRA